MCSRKSLRQPSLTAHSTALAVIAVFIMLVGCSMEAENGTQPAASPVAMETAMVPAQPQTQTGVRPADHVDPFTGMEFVYVKGGTFMMGDLYDLGFDSEKPVHEVTVSDYYIGRYEVTQEEWQKVMGYNGSRYQGPRNPVDQVSWNEIQVFIQKLKEQTGITYRLPTEAEWEYAARGGGTRDKWSGTNKEEEVGDYAWYKENADRQSHPVGTKKPNRLGIYDMSGNLWEWVNDRFSWGYPSAEPQVDPQGPEVSWKNDYRAYRGGAWDYIPRIVRVASRSGKEPDYQRRWIGFRLAKSVDK